MPNLKSVLLTLGTQLHDPALLQLYAVMYLACSTVPKPSFESI